ncbi:HsdM family class I SAM-dependent methyltransferase [Dehalococcoides mccartyi]|uniref:HsdM family class I SAM-dependent methyltransferase n=1 Tax=Dehalococcoides mccartyi TaxID=61435 RepID=UPI001AF38979|nr:N-6 DNA methylase [Dehalococcoides mccartyi]BCT55297.1 type I restriction-modification system, M subunit, putative [Dehalococcoides mccartyi]
MPTKPLQLVNLVGSDGNPSPGLVALRSSAQGNLTIDEQATVYYAESFNRIDFVYFRRFSDGRSSQILAYVVDNSDEKLDEKSLAELHLKVWLHGTAPLLYIAWPNRIDILTCARGPDFWENEDCHYKPVKSFDIGALSTAANIATELNKFSVLRLADGTFWEEPTNGELADYTKTAHQLLIQAVVETDNALNGESQPILRKLLLLMVLVKYLEDRHVFPDNYFSEFHTGATDFFGVLKGGDPQEVYRLLDSLESKFDGDVFSLADPGQQMLTSDILTLFANLVEARTIKQQRYLWKQFSFEHLPVEIISNLYQRFIQGGHGAVYTPPFLASLLLDYAMPYERLTGDERVLDPACGSGIFLVGAFRRLINLWRSRNNWQRPDVDTLKGILKRSIYGIELESSAIDLTAFSMCLAICDALQPDVIWNNLKFDKLRESNLVKADFFSILTKRNQSEVVKDGFDVVIGNPPFESRLSEDGNKVNQTAFSQDIKRGALPDNQSAYLFLEQAFNILCPHGRVCLIQPSGLLYNRNAQSFQAALFSKYRVDVIFDFVSVRKLFDAADPKIIVVLAGGSEPPKDQRITHLTFRRTASVKERICFELDHYDRHHVSQKEVETSSHAWRSNLLGGGRLSDISQRFQDMRNLAEYVKQRHWDYGEGFIVGSGGKLAPFLTGRDFLPASALTNVGIDENAIIPLTETEFHRPKSEALFTPPIILIKKVDSLPIEYWDKRFLSYNHSIVGIHAPSQQASELREFYTIISENHEIYHFLCTLNGTSLIGKATTILKQDIDELPYPEDLKELSFSFWEKALCEDTLKYLTDYIRLGQNSDLLTKAANNDDLKSYSEMFIHMLNSVYSNLKASNPIFFDGLTCQPFYFGDRPNLSWLTEQLTQQKEVELRKLVYDEEKYTYLRTIRILRFYSDNILLLIKPDRLRYWIRSTAIRDADETIIDLRGQGY